MKVLAAMQPYFFPYVGYFSLIDAVDHFVFFDTVQFVRKSWMSRNRILKPSLGDFQFIHVGLASPDYRSQLQDCRISEDREWENQLLRQLEHYKRYAPHYAATIDLLRDMFYERRQYLGDFNAYSITKVCDYLGIEKQFSLFSEANQSYPQASHPGEWGLIISKIYGAQSYVNAPGGEAFYHPDEFRRENIRLGFVHPELKEYRQGISKAFIPGLSILDVLMFNDVVAVRQMIKSYTIDWKS